MAEENPQFTHTLSELVQLTRRLGDPSADLVILSEGNTSVDLGGGTFAVKASGARMDRADRGDFALLDRSFLSPLLAPDGSRTQDDLAQLLAGRPGDGRPNASIETLVHVAALESGATWVAHTHPTQIVGLLASSPHGERMWDAPLFPDEAVVLGTPMWVPYADPGITLGQSVMRRLNIYLDRHGQRPRLILLANHGICALGSSPSEVEAITAMAVKAARIRQIALSAGGLRPLDADEARELSERDDEQRRRAALAIPNQPQTGANRSVRS